MKEIKYGKNYFKMMYIHIKSKAEFAQLLRLGYGSLVKNPWEKFERCMDRYGTQIPCFEITPPNKFVRYATKKFYTDLGYTEGTIEDAKSMLAAEFARK